MKYIINEGDKTHPLYHKSYLSKIYSIENLYIFSKLREKFEINRKTIPFSRGKFLGYSPSVSIYFSKKTDVLVFSQKKRIKKNNGFLGGIKKDKLNRDT